MVMNVLFWDNMQNYRDAEEGTWLADHEARSGFADCAMSWFSARPART
jgi:hypothetical protein